jgi:Protein of unknown function (DUF3037)
MQEQHLYEYAVIRVLPAVEREEFLNVGIVLFCKRAKYIKVLYTLNTARFAAFAGDLDLEQVQKNLDAFEKIAMGTKNCGPIAELDVPSRFRWLTAIRSSAIQTSRPHPGLCTNLDDTAQRLFTEMVL